MDSSEGRSSNTLPFDLTKEDLIADPELRVARPPRLSAAWSIMKDAHAIALTDYRNLDARATTVVGWVSAIFAVALLRSTGTPALAGSPAALLSFFALLTALLFALRIHSPRDVRAGGYMDPMDIYEYQTAQVWDHTAPRGFTEDEVAEAQTRLKLVQQTSTAIKNLQAASTRKQRLLWWSHFFFVAGLGCLAVALVYPHH